MSQFSSKDWDHIGGGLIVPGGSVPKPQQEVRRAFNTTPTKMQKQKEVEMPEPVFQAMNIEVDRLVDRYLGETTDMQNVIKLEDALYELGQEYGVTIVLHVYEKFGEAFVDINTAERIRTVAEDTPNAALQQMFVDKAHGKGTAKVKSDVDVLFDTKASQEENLKYLGKKKHK